MAQAALSVGRLGSAGLEKLFKLFELKNGPKRGKLNNTAKLVFGGIFLTDMAKKINYDDWSKEELIKELRRIKEMKYGLVWHRDLPEEKIDILINPDARTPNEMFPNEMAGKPFPVLRESKGKAIETDKSKPVNLLIEGDNYHSLAVLNFTHREAIDLIYIDPPYNTGHKDFSYNDKIVDIEDPFRHSKWLSFMEKRLKLAKTLLKLGGVIFVSIDDNEQAPLKMLCDEIFGPENFLSTIIWQHSVQPKGYTDKFSVHHNYILCYQKSSLFQLNALERTAEHNKNYSNPDNDPRGMWRSGDVRNALYRPNLIFEIKTPSGKVIKPPKKGWRWSKETLAEKVKTGEIIFSKDESKIVHKIYLENLEGRAAETIWFGKDVGTTREAAQELKDFFNGEATFDTPKPVRLVQQIIKLNKNHNAIVLDFFAGSGTTGQAVIEANKDDGGNRQFILCTNNEEMDGNGDKIKHKICSDVCYPRLKKVIKGYKNIKGADIAGLGGNLKYYTCDFVEAEPTDRNKRKLVCESTEMLCIRENAFELVQDAGDFKIFKNSDKYLGIVFYEEAIDDFKKAIKKIKGHFNTYVFSLGDDPHEKQFADVKGRVTLCAIPEVILKVYREIFK